MVSPHYGSILTGSLFIANCGLQLSGMECAGPAWRPPSALPQHWTAGEGQPQVLMCCCCCRCGPEPFSGLADAEYFSMPQITSSQSLLYRARYYLWFHDSLTGMGPILRIRAPVLLPRF